MKFISTRGSAPALSFEGALLAALADDGGLFLPESWPQLSPDEIAARAYDLYLQRDRTPGDPVEDWLQAEQELRAERE